MVLNWILDKKQGFHGMISEIYKIFTLDNSITSSLFLDYQICRDKTLINI